MSSEKHIEKLLGEKIKNVLMLGGGCIGNARKIETVSGRILFVKSYSDTNKFIIRNEANGLKELRKANAIKVPDVIALNDEILILEYIEIGKRQNNFSELFGIQLAKLHKYYTEYFGFYENNFIGATPQININRTKNWSEFYWTERLLFQFRLAESKNLVNDKLRKCFLEFEKIYPKIIEGTEEKPSLIHGDLWNGNFMVSVNGKPVLIDPAVYYGHREAELGMTFLFGGFDRVFYEAYNIEYPLITGWQERIPLYKLYHVLNHMNLFGTSYLSQAIEIIKKYC